MGHEDEGCRFAEGVNPGEGDELSAFIGAGVTTGEDGAPDSLRATMVDGSEVEGVVRPRLGPWLVTTRICQLRPFRAPVKECA